MKSVMVGPPLVILMLLVVVGLIFVIVAITTRRSASSAIGGSRARGSGPGVRTGLIVGGLLIGLLFLAAFFALGVFVVREESRSSPARVAVHGTPHVNGIPQAMEKVVSTVGAVPAVVERAVTGMEKVSSAVEKVAAAVEQIPEKIEKALNGAPIAPPQALPPPAVSAPVPPTPPAIPAPLESAVAPGPSTSGRLSLSSLSATDDLDAWNAADVLAPADAPKPWWVSDAAGSQPWSAAVFGAELKGRRPGPRGKLVGYSGLEPEPTSAFAAAQLSAAHQIRSLLVLGAKDFPELSGSGAQRLLLRALEPFEVEVRRYVAENSEDRFAEAVPGKTGYTYHRAALLVQAAPASFEPLVEKFRQTVARTAGIEVETRQKLVLTVGSALGLALVVFLLYSFVNAGTKGHFAWPLRIISIGTLIVLYLGLMYLQGWIPR